MSFLRPALAIAAKDLRIELRHRAALVTTAVFAVLVMMVFVFTRQAGDSTLAALAPNVLWIMIALASIVALNRAFVLEREHGALDALLLAPVSRAAIFWGKWLANVIFVLLVLAVAFPLWIVFFDVEPRFVLFALAGVAILTVVGFTAAGTVFSAIAVRTRFAELLLPVLLLPFMLPPVFFAGQLTSRLLASRPAEEWLGLLRLLALYDVVFLTLATMLFPAVMDE